MRRKKQRFVYYKFTSLKFAVFISAFYMNSVLLSTDDRWTSLFTCSRFASSSLTVVYFSVTLFYLFTFSLYEFVERAINCRNRHRRTNFILFSSTCVFVGTCPSLFSFTPLLAFFADLHSMNKRFSLVRVLWRLQRLKFFAALFTVFSIEPNSMHLIEFFLRYFFQ